jgi:hypothetical protein
MAIIGDRGNPSSISPSISSPVSGVVDPGTVLRETDFQKALQATGTTYIVATVFAAD